MRQYIAMVRFSLPSHSGQPVRLAIILAAALFLAFVAADYWRGGQHIGRMLMVASPAGEQPGPAPTPCLACRHTLFGVPPHPQWRSHNAMQAPWLPPAGSPRRMA